MLRIVTGESPSEPKISVMKGVIAPASSPKTTGLGIERDSQPVKPRRLMTATARPATT